MFAAFLAALSLGVNIYILLQIASLRRNAIRAMQDAIAVLEALQRERFDYTLTVDDTMEVNTRLPIRETVPVRIHDWITVDQTVEVPVHLGLFGERRVTVPIQTVIPIELEIPVKIDQSFAVKAEVPVYLEVPVGIAVRDTPLHHTIDDVMGRLHEHVRELNGNKPHDP